MVGRVVVAGGQNKGPMGGLVRPKTGDRAGQGGFKVRGRTKGVCGGNRARR